MPRSVTRELTITYNDVTIGGSDEDHRLTGFFRLRQEPEVGQAEWDTLVVGSTEAAFTANCRNFEEKIAEPWNDLKIQQGSSILLDVQADDAVNTALNPTVTAQKVGTTTDTGRTRRYHCVATWGRPADYPNADSEGLRDYDVLVSFTPARRMTVAISGTYTAVTTNLARAQYDAKIEAFATAVLTAISGSATFEIVEEDSSHDVNDKTLVFTRIYDEVIFSQGSGGVANANIVSQTLNIVAGELGAEAHPDYDAQALGTATLRYSAWFDKDETTDLAGEYNGLRSWLITQAETYFGANSVALISEDPTYDPVENRIDVTMVLRGTHSGAYIEVRFVVEDQVDYGFAAVHAWTGKPFTKYVYQAEASALRSIRMTMLADGQLSQAEVVNEFVSFAGEESGPKGGAGNDADSLDAKGPPRASPLTASGGKWYTQSRRVTVDPHQIGIPGTQILLTRATGEAVRFWAANVDGGSGTVGGDPPSGGSDFGGSSGGGSTF